MEESEQISRAKLIMTRVVSEKIPQAERWSVPKEFKAWIDGLQEEEFKAYLQRLSGLTKNLSDEPTAREAGKFIVAKSYTVDQIPLKERLDVVGGEATAYYALALWRTLETEELVSQLKQSI